MGETDRSEPGAVADSTVLIYLAKLERLDDVASRFGTVQIPGSVYEEVVRAGKRLEHPDAILVETAVERAILEVARPSQIPPVLQGVGLEYADQAVLAMAMEEGIETVLTDDAGLRAIARTQDRTPRGTLAFLVQALRDGRLSFDSYLAALEQLTQAGFRLSSEVYAKAVRRGREIAAGDA